MALSEKFLLISVIVIFNLLWIHGATISRPFANDLYPISPSEVLQVKPLLIYPRSRNLKYFKSTDQHAEEDKVIYVKLMKLNYRPKHMKSIDDFDVASKDATSKDIFYVKALTNGQFSDHRLRLYRIPEFYAINVYKKNEVI